MGTKIDKKVLRRMNLVGTIFFALFGSIVVLMFSYNVYRNHKHSLEMDYYYDYSSDLNMILIILAIIVISSILLYYYSVIGLDRGKYKAAKRCLIIGILFGWIGWLIPSYVFFKSYLSFDEAIKLDDNASSRWKLRESPSMRKCCLNDASICGSSSSERGYDRVERLRRLWTLIYSMIYKHGTRSNRHAEGVAQTV